MTNKPNPEKDLADFTYGNGWGKWIEGRVEKVEKESSSFRAAVMKLDDIKQGVDKLGSEWVEFQHNDKKRFTRLEKRVDSIENERFEDEDEEITGVQSVDKLQRNARGQRARVKRWKRSAKIIAPMLVGAGAAAVELVRAILAASGK